MQRLLLFLRSGRGLRSFAAVVLGVMVLVILEGAVVRATGSGAGCGNHWPLCNGEVLPHHPRLATVIEFTHRSLTGICSTLFFALLAWLFVAKPKGDPARTAGLWSALFLLTEALLGAVLVKGGYVEHNVSTARVFVQCIHFTNTMVLLAVLTLTWWQLCMQGSSARDAVRASLVWLALAATIVTGATGSVAALADTLFPSASLHAALVSDLAANSPLLLRMRVLHPLAACVGFASVTWLWSRSRTRAANAAMTLLVLQVASGLLDVVLLAPLWLQLLHLLLADLFWIALVATAADLLRTRATQTAHVRSFAAV